MHSIEQQIYASLAVEGVRPGHHTHAASPGLSAQAIERHEEVCNRWGSYEPGADFNRSLVQVPLWLDESPPSDPSHFVVVLITFQGRDAGGRPGAVLRHIVRVPRQLYEALEYNPFHLLRQRKLLEVWTPDTPLPVLEGLEDRTAPEDLQAIFPERYPLLRAMLGHFLGSQRLYLATASDSPAIEESLAELLELTPISLRRRLSLATFAYRHAHEYNLAGVRQEGASFRRTLEQIQTAAPPDLDAAAQEYLDTLFGALESKDWTHARSLIHETELAPPGPDPDVAESEGRAEADGDVDGEEESPPSSEALGEPRTAMTSPPPEMPYRRFSEQQEKRSWRGRLLRLLAVIVVVAIGGFYFLRGRDGPADSPSTSPGTQLQRLQAANLEVFIADHETLLSEMLAQGRRDFDLQEDLATAVASWPGRATRALQGESVVVEAALDKVVSGAQDQAAAEAALSEAATRAEQNARRGEALFRMMSASTVDVLRQSYDERGRRLTIEPADGAIEQETMVQARQWGEALQRSAQGMALWTRAATGRDRDAWAEAAVTLKEAVEAVPASLRAPNLVQAASAVSAGMADVLGAENARAQQARALAMPYRAEAPKTGELGQAATRLRRAVEELGQSGGLKLPPPVATVERFYRVSQDAVARGLAESPGVEPSDFLREVASLCAEDNALCKVSPYAAHVARWKLEAWRRVGGIASTTGRPVWAKVGEEALPEGGAADLGRVLGLLDRMERAPVPAAPSLVEEVQSLRAGMGAGFYADLFDAWSRRQRQGSQARQAAFQQVYEGVQQALAALRAASPEQAPAAYAGLRQSMAALRRVDLTQAAAGGEATKVEATRALARALDATSELTVESLEVKLLTDTDYAGTRRPLAKLTVTVSEVAGDGPSLLSVVLPPMLSAPGVGFDKVTHEVARTIALEPQGRLLVTGRDEDGTLWFHYHVDPPAQGHVGTALAAAREVKIPPDVARQIADQDGALPELGNDGSPVARVRFKLREPWWSEVIASLPELP